MNLRECILTEHSKANCLRIANWVDTHPDRFQQLFTLLRDDDKRIAQRAAWPLSICVERHPSLMDDKTNDLLHELSRGNLSPAVMRNSMRILYHIHIPEEYEGRIVELCINYLVAKNIPVAIKAFSMAILEKTIPKYPELLREIKWIIEEQMPHQTPGFIVRAKKLLKLAEKNKDNPRDLF